MKYSALFAILAISTIVVGALSSVATAEVGNPYWTGGDTTCSSGNQNWSDVDNWEDAEGASPNSGPVDLKAFRVCDPCETIICATRGGCPPPDPCQLYCWGGPHDGEECETQEECEPCAGGTWTAIYNCMDDDDPCGGTPYETDNFTTIRVEADPDHSITMRKTGDREMALSGYLYLEGYSPNSAILDIQAQDCKPQILSACGKVQITVAASNDVYVQNRFEIGCSTSQTDVTLTGSGDLDVATNGSKTIVMANWSNKTTLIVDAIGLAVDALEVHGGNSASKLATFLWNSGTATVTSRTSLKMKGHSLFQINDASSYVVTSDLTVDTNSWATEAKIKMLSSSWRFQAVNINITSGSTDDATLTMETAKLKCTGTVTITGGSTATAKLAIPLGIVTELTHIELKTRGALDLNESVDIDQFNGKLTLSADSTSGSELDIATGENLKVDKLNIKKDVAYTPVFDTDARVEVN